MRAIVVEDWTEPGQLTVKEIAAPQLSPGSLLIEVRAAGCNFFDILMVQGRYQQRPPFPFTPGAEVGDVHLRNPLRVSLVSIESSLSSRGNTFKVKCLWLAVSRPGFCHDFNLLTFQP